MVQAIEPTPVMREALSSVLVLHGPTPRTVDVSKIGTCIFHYPKVSINSLK